MGQINYAYLRTRWARWQADSQHILIYSDNDVPSALCLTNHIDNWNVIDNTTEFYWEFSVCGIDGGIDWAYDIWSPDFTHIAGIRWTTVTIGENPDDIENYLIIETQAHIQSAEWSPDSNFIMTISHDYDAEDTYIELWDAHSGKRLTTYSTNNDYPSARWSPDEKSIVIVSGKIRITP